MMGLKVGLAAALVGLATFGTASGQAPRGYLASLPDPTTILRPAPKEGDPRDLEDKRVFEASRKLEGGPRWSMAQADLPFTPTSRLESFSCAVGVKLNGTTAPKVLEIFMRTTFDVGRLNSAAKTAYARVRPYKRWGGATCAAASPGLDKSFDYPSGHAQLGWTDALVLAALAPDRAAEVLARGRAYADSRAVCGVHTVSATEAGMVLASAQFARTAAEPAFRADLEAARAELDALRSKGPKPDAAVCSAEAALNKSPF